MKNDLVIDDEYFAFRIYNNYKSSVKDSITLRDNGNILDICKDVNTGNIIYIEATIIESIYNDKIYLPDIRSDNDLILFPKAISNYNDERIPHFMINYDCDELSIIFSSNINPYYYYVDNRTEYYYDENLNLLYVKVINLTEEECKFLSSFNSSVSIFK